MSNDPLRSISAREAVQALEQSESQFNGNSRQHRGHPAEIKDTVSIGVSVGVLDKLYKTETIDEVFELLPYEKKQQERANAKDGVQTHTEKVKERVLEYLKLPGERLDQPYMFEAARAAMLQLLSDNKGSVPATETTVRTYASLLDKMIQQKEGNPNNQPDVHGEMTVRHSTFA